MDWAPAPKEPRRLDVEASLAAASAASAQQMDEMSRCLESAYAKIEALQHQTRILNEEANVLSEENDRLTNLLAEKEEAIVVLREQVQELGNTVVQLESERQNNEFSNHMLIVDQAIQNRTYQRLRRGFTHKASVSQPRREPTQSPEPVARTPLRAPSQPLPQQSPSSDVLHTEEISKLKQQRDKLLTLQQEGMVGLESALAAIEAKLDATVAESRHSALQNSLNRPYYPPVGAKKRKQLIEAFTTWKQHARQQRLERRVVSSLMKWYWSRLFMFYKMRVTSSIHQGVSSPSHCIVKTSLAAYCALKVPTSRPCRYNRHTMSECPYVKESGRCPVAQCPVCKANKEEVSDKAKEKAEKAKEEGNQAFKVKDYKTALRHYTLAVNLVPNSHVYRSNRSAAYSGLSMYKEALDDAQHAIKANTMWPKGYSRAGLAFRGLRYYHLSGEAYSKAIELGDNSELTAEALAEVQKLAKESGFTRDDETKNLAAEQDAEKQAAMAETGCSVM
eukprot:TRINITY_DN6165_c0_g1_i2.p1 TRINITY_DN6165_c0_g1~~TRINITY_DN6165_c0_g1_i2.p1  ORF type:complete len:505 (+),score=106.11 TRINITY_DN6165_c0_g1_i2:1126-2640(+)